MASFASAARSMEPLNTSALSSSLRILAAARRNVIFSSCLSINPPHSRSLGSSGVAIISRPPRLRFGSTSSTLTVRCFSALNSELKSTLDKVVKSQKVLLFMKGTKDFPQCGFSNTVVQILKSLNVPFQTVNILDNEMLRQGLKEYSNWPTFPQLYIDGEFFGGCDITVEAYKNGQLQELLEKVMCS